MKKIFTLSALAFSLLWNAQNTEITKIINLGDGNDWKYSGYYNIENNTETLKPIFDWDISFYTKNKKSVDIRVNSAGGVTLYYPNVSEESIENYTHVPSTDNNSMKEYINDVAEWGKGGAFQANADKTDANDFGWGTKTNGRIEGNKVIILQNARGEYFKVKINYKDDKNYNFSFAPYSTGKWGEVRTVEIPINEGESNYTYYSLTNNQIVNEEPDQSTPWDLLFTKYKDVAGKKGAGIGDFDFYFGTLQNQNVTVAKVSENEDFKSVEKSRYQNKANTIGDQWNELYALNFDENIRITEDKYFFVKNQKNDVYRLEFVSLKDQFEGHAVTFKTKKLNENLSTVDKAAADFNIYLGSNPTVNKSIDVVFNLKKSASKGVKLLVHSIDGKQVYQEIVSSNSLFFTKKINLQNLPEGLYLITVIYNNTRKTIKVILR